MCTLSSTREGSVCGEGDRPAQKPGVESRLLAPVGWQRLSAEGTGSQGQSRKDSRAEVDSAPDPGSWGAQQVPGPGGPWPRGVSRQRAAAGPSWDLTPCLPVRPPAGGPEGVGGRWWGARGRGLCYSLPYVMAPAPQSGSPALGPALQSLLAQCCVVGEGCRGQDWEHLAQTRPSRQASWKRWSLSVV